MAQVKAETIRVILAVSDHLLVGSLPRSSDRLRDVLLREDTDFFALDNVQVYRHDLSESPVATLSEVIISKKLLVWVGVWEEHHEAPEKRFYNFQSKVQAHVVVIVESYRIQGIAHLTRTTNNIPYALHREGGRFFSVTQAIVQCGLMGTLNSPFLLVNNERVSVFGVPTVTGGPRREPPVSRFAEREVAEDTVLGLYKDVKCLVDEYKSANSASMPSVASGFNQERDQP